MQYKLLILHESRTRTSVITDDSVDKQSVITDVSLAVTPHPKTLPLRNDPGRAGLRIGIVGGLGRAEPMLRKLAMHSAHTIEFHSGDVGGRGSASLEAVVARSELLVVITDLNSHGSVQLSRKLAKANGVPRLVVKRLSLGRFADLLQSLDTSTPVQIGVAS